MSIWQRHRFPQRLRLWCCWGARKCSLCLHCYYEEKDAIQPSNFTMGWDGVKNKKRVASALLPRVRSWAGQVLRGNHLYIWWRNLLTEKEWAKKSGWTWLNHIRWSKESCWYFQCVYSNLRALIFLRASPCTCLAQQMFEAFVSDIRQHKKQPVMLSFRNV